MKKQLYSIVTLICFAGIIGCQHHPVEPFVDDDPTDSTACDPTIVYFNKDIMPIIQSGCAIVGCHGGGSAEDGVDLTTYESIIATADVEAGDPDGSDLYEVITETDPDKRMPQPPNDPLTPEQIALIEKWINQGAKNINCYDCDESVFTFSGAVKPIIDDNCIGCHSGADPQGGVSLTTYEEIEAYALSGALYGVINHEEGYAPMPYGLAKLSDCNINQVKQWIDNGAMDD